jgi:hypothetical protein
MGYRNPIVKYRYEKSIVVRSPVWHTNHANQRVAHYLHLHHVIACSHEYDIQPRISSRIPELVAAIGKQRNSNHCYDISRLCCKTCEFYSSKVRAAGLA